jgi:hypothetical protein
MPAGNKSIWTTFTNGKDASWAVNITTAFSIANTVANVVSGFGTDFLWAKVHPAPSTCAPCVRVRVCVRVALGALTCVRVAWVSSACRETSCCRLC